MAGVYAADGSLQVTVAAGSSIVVSTGAGNGAYAADGSHRVTVVGAGTGSGAAVVQDGGAISVRNSANNDTVVGTVDLTTTPGTTKAVLPSTVAMVSNGEAVTMRDLSPLQTSGTATVANGAVTYVVSASGAKIIRTGDVYPCPAPTGTYTTSISFTVVNGQITGVVLS